MSDRWATFDCYGTLVDWNRGIRRELARLWPEADSRALLARYHEIEPRVQLGRTIPYRRILTEALELLADSEGLTLAQNDAAALADSLPSWSPFPEVPAALADVRGRGWRIGILSNTDADLLSASLDAIGVPVDVTVTAQDAGSYKPAHGHWSRFFELEPEARGRHVHVAASLFHDIAPAAELRLAAVWVNRLDETSDLPRAAELRDLSTLPEALEKLVPALG
jgi:2-haloacid dehalogenase